MMEFAFILFALLVAMYFSRRWLARAESSLELYDAAMNEFIDASETLLADNDTPPSIVDLIQFMRERAGDPSSARVFLKHILRRKEQVAKTPRIGDLEALEKARPELGRVLSVACSAAFFAITYNSLFAGILLRRFVLFDAKERSGRTKELAESYHEIERSVGHHDHFVPA